MKDRRKQKKGENGKLHKSSLSPKEAVAANPTFLSGTGRGEPGCPTLKVRGKPPEGVTVSETAKGATKASIRGMDISEVLRWMGRNGYNWHQAAGMCRVLAIPARRNTLVSQINAGASAEQWKRSPAGRKSEKDSLRGNIPRKLPSEVLREVERAVRKGNSEYEFDL